MNGKKKHCKRTNQQMSADYIIFVTSSQIFSSLFLQNIHMIGLIYSWRKDIGFIDLKVFETSHTSKTNSTISTIDKFPSLFFMVQREVKLIAPQFS